MAVSKREPITAGIVASFNYLCCNPSNEEENRLVISHHAEEKYTDESPKGQ
jgi:hypothetical protein